MMRGLCILLGLALCGCGTDYCWRSSVPEAVRTVSVPTFRNESDLNELGAVASRQVLREFQREGTFSICRADDAAVEVQGIVKRVTVGSGSYNRRTLGRMHACDMTAQVEISVIDKRAGRVLVDSRLYRARTTMTFGQDKTTAERDAAGRLADDLSRQVVDDVLNLKW